MARHLTAPFVGVDGEGAGADEKGRQLYRLFRAGERELYTGRPLGTAEILDFLCELPKKPIYVGYYFGYDATMILRDLPAERLRWLLRPVERGKGRSPYTFWEDWGIWYVPGQHFSICRIDRDKLRVIPGTARVINEVSGFFRQPFLAALNAWQIGTPAARAEIGAGKAARGQKDNIGAAERKYCAAECDALGELMEQFRGACIAGDCAPAAWRGAGALAASLLRRHRIPKADQLPRRQITLEKDSLAAYYGGRTEITRVGRIAGPVYAYDLNSAYAWGITKLPCPHHTRWRRFAIEDQPAPGEIYSAELHFRTPRTHFIAPFPVRSEGRLFFPREARGWYWSPEIEAALAAGVEVSIWRGWRAETRCDCRPWDWMDELFRLRRDLGRRGEPLKTALAALYGKFAQRLGGAPWRDHIAAGLVTSSVRARVYGLAMAAGDDCLMIATDAVYSQRRLQEVDTSPDLGCWREGILVNGVFIVQPGVWWSGLSAKTRGMPLSTLAPYKKCCFEYLWKNRRPHTWPEVSILERTFVGHRLAQERGNLDLAGRWLEEARKISFDPSAKRVGAKPMSRFQIERMTYPHAGAGDLRSEPFDPKRPPSELYMEMLKAEAMPDFVPKLD